MQKKNARSKSKKNFNFHPFSGSINARFARKLEVRGGVQIKSSRPHVRRPTAARILETALI